MFKNVGFAVKIVESIEYVNHSKTEGLEKL